MKTPLLITCLVSITANLYALNFVAYGDSRTHVQVHQKLLNELCKENPELIIHTGDLWDEYSFLGWIWEGFSSRIWINQIESNPTSKALFHANKYLVTKGNHETAINSILNIKPSLVRGGTIPYAFRQGNCFFISAGEEPTNLQWIEMQLKSEASQNAKWRIIWAHHPCYSTGRYSTDGAYQGFRALVDKYHVNMYFSGHDHIYERTKLINNGSVVSQDNHYNLSKTPGAVYIVTGGGGAPLYEFKSTRPWTAAKKVVYHYCYIQASDSELKYTAKSISGEIIDQFTMTR